MPIVPSSLRVLGVSFATAPLAVRESLSYDAEVTRDLLGSARIDGLNEAAVVSTCNRTEFYLGVGECADVEGQWIEYVRRRRPHARIGDEHCRLFHASGAQAARHLFRVATGIDSAILGDAHIGGQLKQAMTRAATAGTLGPMLNHTFQAAFGVMKTATRQTDIGRGHASLGSSIAGLVRERRGNGPLHVLVLGAGVAARDVARQLSKWQLGTLTIVNRTLERATALADLAGARAVDWNMLETELLAADVVVAAVSARAPVVSADRLAAVLRLRDGRPLLVVDAGVPHNVEPVDGIDYITIDDVSLCRDQALERRRRAVPAVESIVEAAVLQWQQWCWAQQGEAMLRTAFTAEASVRRELVDRLLASGYDGQREQLDDLVRRAWRPVLTEHARSLRAWLRDSAHPQWFTESLSTETRPAPRLRPV